jgi:putative transcriptional regulator
MSSVYDSIMTGLQEAVNYENGNISARKVKVTVLPLPKFTPDDIREVRNSLKLSQTAFSGVLGVSKKAVEAWESGRNIPQGPALRMIDILKNNPQFVNAYIDTAN